MFKVIALIDEKTIRIVYSVHTNERGIIEFLIWVEGGGWIWMNSDLYRPLVKTPKQRRET